MSFAELRTRPRRAIAIVAASAAACVLVYATMSARWLATVDPDDVGGFGLRTFTTCDADHCVTVPIDAMARMVGAHPSIIPVGWVVSIAAWIAAAALLLSAGLAVFGKFVFRPIAPTSVAALASIVTLIASCIFVAVNPARPAYQAGSGFWFGGASAAIGILAAIFIARERTPDWDETPGAVDEDAW